MAGATAMTRQLDHYPACSSHRNSLRRAGIYPSCPTRLTIRARASRHRCCFWTRPLGNMAPLHLSGARSYKCASAQPAPAAQDAQARRQLVRLRATSGGLTANTALATVHAGRIHDGLSRRPKTFACWTLVADDSNPLVSPRCLRMS